MAGATGAALAVWAVAVPLAGATLNVRLNGAVQHVGAGSVAGTALLAGLAGWPLLAGLERFGRRPRRTWAITAGVLMSASLAGRCTAAWAEGPPRHWRPCTWPSGSSSSRCSPGPRAARGLLSVTGHETFLPSTGPRRPLIPDRAAGR